MRSALAAGLAVLAAPLFLGCAANADETDTAGAEIIAALPACQPTLSCAAPSLQYQPRGWRHGFSSSITSAIGDARHRGHDLFVNPGAPQTIIGKFAYGAVDKDLKDEDVDIFVQRECGSPWEKVGTARTSDDGDHDEVRGVEDNGGRIYFEIPAQKRLGPGKHRVKLVVAGDGSSADMVLDVVPRDTKIFVSDVDGTLTSSENVEFVAMLTGDVPETHEGAAAALQALAAKGYRPMYITARPEWLTERTREFLVARGFPDGIIHTSPSTTGAGLGEGAAEFKTKELGLLAEKGLVPTYGFGNKSSDSEAYASIPDPSNRIFFQIEGDFSGRKIDSYTELLPAFTALSPVCR